MNAVCTCHHGQIAHSDYDCDAPGCGCQGFEEVGE